MISSVIKQSSQNLKGFWSIVQQNMPRNILNFSIKYLNNALPTRKNFCRWAISPLSNCSFCLQSETVQPVISSCKSYLVEGRYTWRHNSVLLFLENTFSSLKQCIVYADLPSFLSPCFITGESNRPDLLLLTNKNTLYILELKVGFEASIQNNSDSKTTKYSSLINDFALSLSLSYSKVQFVNLSMSAIVAMGSSCNSLLSLLNDLHFDKTMQERIIVKAMSISIRLHLLSSE